MKPWVGTIIAILTIFLVFPCLVIAVTLTKEEKQSNQNSPVKYITETISAPEGIDPATNYESFGSGLNELIYETLIDYKGNSVIKLEGILAESWTVSSDGLQYNFTLRQGVTFHDGVKFNAYVMKYSLDRMIIINDHWGPSWMIQQAVAGGSTIMSMDDVNITQAITFVTGGAFVVIDEFIFQINLETAYTPLIYALAYRVGAAVSPKAIAENTPTDYVVNDADYTYGMFSLTDWFPTLTEAEVRTNLGLTTDWNVDVSGVVPSSPADNENSHDWMADHAVGTGPYMLVSLDLGTVVV